MKIKLILITMLVNVSCQAQTTTNMQNTNPLLCNPDSGVCEMPTNTNNSNESYVIKSALKPIKIIYYTDPICSSCWGIEPQLRRLKLEYGHLFEIEYRMGGLLPDWSYNSGGISKPSDVAHHWDEVSKHYDMPIDGDVWLEDPLSSSYPPSIAFKAAQLQDEHKAITFLRIIREMVFLERKNITRWEHLKNAAKNAGLDIVQFESDYNGKAKEKFAEDLKLAQQLGVRGFPTLYFSNGNINETLYGVIPYVRVASTILKMFPEATKKDYDKTAMKIFAIYPTLTLREFSELTGMPKDSAEIFLNKMTSNAVLEKMDTKNGAIWRKQQIN